MRLKIHPDSVILWLSARDTSDWATRPGAAWPCSTLADHRICAEFDRNGLVDLTIDGRSLGKHADVDCNEFNACTSDHLRGKLPIDHPAYLVAVGQFQSANEVS
jgi:hypothetical protein